MTKLPLLPLTPLESNRNSSSSFPHKGVSIKTESNYNQSHDVEANLLVRTMKRERSLISSDTVEHENEEDGFTSLTGFPLADIIGSQHESNGTSILSIQEHAVLGVDEKNGVIPHKIKNSVTLQPMNKSDLGEDVVSVDSEKTLSESIKVSEEVQRNKQKFPLNSPPLWGLTSICGRRREMEDKVIALPSFLRIPSSMLDDNPRFSSVDHDSIAHVFGIYDGHGGCQVANYCRDRLHVVLAEEIGKGNEYNCNWEEQWVKVFLRCFNKLDNEVGGFPVIASETPFPPIAPDSVGSTAVVAVVCSSHIIVANCGDSRAVLYRGKVPMPLSVDHKPNCEEECTRIEAAGGRVINWDGYRVSGFLAVSRSIGDRYLRPYVIADPEVIFVPRAKEDECIILASDGLWDVMTNGEACDLARRRILMWHKKNGGDLAEERGRDIDPAAQDAADYLAQLALQRGSRDNISVVVVDLKAQRKFKNKNLKV